MKLYLDTADAQAVHEVSQVLTVSGVTTNPTIITKSGLAPEQVFEDMLRVLDDDQSFFVQVIQTSYEGILEDAHKICSMRDKNIFPKIPVTHEGMHAIRTLKAEGIECLATVIHSANQAFLAAMNGAHSLAPYVNRMCNYGDGVAEVADLIQMLDINELSCEVIAASVKNTRQIHELIAAGIQAITIPPELAWAMLDHPATALAVDGFSAAWQESYGKDSL